MHARHTAVSAGLQPIRAERCWRRDVGIEIYHSIVYVVVYYGALAVVGAVGGALLGRGGDLLIDLAAATFGVRRMRGLPRIPCKGSLFCCLLFSCLVVYVFCLLYVVVLLVRLCWFLFVYEKVSLTLGSASFRAGFRVITHPLELNSEPVAAVPLFTWDPVEQTPPPRKQRRPEATSDFSIGLSTLCFVQWLWADWGSGNYDHLMFQIQCVT